MCFLAVLWLMVLTALQWLGVCWIAVAAGARWNYGSEPLNAGLLASWWVLLLLNVEVMCVVNVGVVSEMVSEMSEMASDR